MPEHLPFSASTAIHVFSYGESFDDDEGLHFIIF